jgi:hypothetical protein
MGRSASACSSDFRRDQTSEALTPGLRPGQRAREARGRRRPCLISGRINPLKAKARKRWRGETNPPGQRGRVVLPFASLRRSFGCTGEASGKQRGHSGKLFGAEFETGRSPSPEEPVPCSRRADRLSRLLRVLRSSRSDQTVRRRRRNAMGGLPAGVWHPLSRLSAVTRVLVAKGPCCFTRYGAQKSSGGLFGQAALRVGASRSGSSGGRKELPGQRPEGGGKPMSGAARFHR